MGAAINSEMADRLQKRQAAAATKSREQEEAEAAAEALARQQAEALAQQQTEVLAQPGTTIPIVPMGPDGKGYVRGTFDYEAADAGELGFHTGDIITVLSQDESGWWQGELNGATGWFPANFTEACPAPAKKSSSGGGGSGSGAAALDEAIGDAKVETLTSFSRARVKGKRPPRKSTRLGATVKTRTETNDSAPRGGDDEEERGVGGMTSVGGGGDRGRIKSFYGVPAMGGMNGELQNLFNKGGKGSANVATRGRAPATKPQRSSGGEKSLASGGGGLPFAVNLRSSKQQTPQQQSTARDEVKQNKTKTTHKHTTHTNI